MRTTALKRLIPPLLLALIFALLPMNGIAEDTPFEIQGEWIAGTIYSNALRRLSMQSEGMLTADDYQIVYEIDESEKRIYLNIAEDGSSEDAEAAFERISDTACIVYNVVDAPIGYFIERCSESSDSPEFLCYEIKLDTAFFLYDGKIIKDKAEKLEYLFLEDQLYITDGNEYMGGNVVFYGDGAFMLDTGSTITWNENYPPIEVWMLFVKSDIIQQNP